MVLLIIPKKLFAIHCSLLHCSLLQQILQTQIERRRDAEETEYNREDGELQPEVFVEPVTAERHGAHDHEHLGAHGRVAHQRAIIR